MTKNQIELAALNEQKRHNKQEETFRERESGAKVLEATVNKPANILKAIYKSRNDGVWYNSNPAMVDNAANLSYDAVGGVPYYAEYQSHALPAISVTSPGTGQPITNDVTVKSVAKGQPGIGVIRFVPCYGRPGVHKDLSAIKQTALALYSYIRHANSGAKNYEYNDLFMYILAMDSAYYVSAWAERIYRILNSRASNSYYIPHAILDVMRIDRSMVKDMPRLAEMINRFRENIATLAVPKSFPLYSRHTWMCANAFVDTPNYGSSGQYWIYEPEGYYTFSTQTIIGYSASGLKFHKFTETITLDKLNTIFNNIVESLLTVEDIATMSGDILKAFKDGGIITQSMVDVGAKIDFVYSEEVLNQIQNCVLVGDVENVDIGQITDGNDAGSIVVGGRSNGFITTDKILKTFASVDEANAFITNSSPFVSPVPFMHMYKDKANPLDNLIASRGVITMQTWLDRTSSNYDLDMRMQVRSCGSEVFTTLDVCITEIDKETEQITSRIIPGLNSLSWIPAASGEDSSTFLTTVADKINDFNYVLETMTYCPQIGLTVRWDYGNTTVVGYPLIRAMDSDRWAPLNPKVIDKMHEVALRSLFGLANFSNIK